MPKSMVVDPSVVRKPGMLEIASIPVNQYKSDFKAELARFGAEGLKRIWLDMVYIREFESMLNTFKTQGPGTASSTTTRAPPTCPSGRKRPRWASAPASSPTTSSSGRTAATARSSRSASPPRAGLGEKELVATMEGFLGGETLRFAEKVPHKGAADLAEAFILFGTLAEIFAPQGRLQPGPGRVDARLLHALRLDAEQRDRRRLRGHRHRRGALQAHQPQGRHRRRPTSATPRWAAAPCGRPCASPRWTSTARSGPRMSAALRPSSSTSSTTSTAWAARPTARRWATRSSPASARA